MMAMTIFSFIGAETWSSAAWLGYGSLVGMVVALAFSSQRWLLLYLFRSEEHTSELQSR